MDKDFDIVILLHGDDQYAPEVLDDMYTPLVHGEMVLVVPMQRPRPSYMFMLTLFLMAMAGMSFFIATHRFTFVQQVPELFSIIIIIFLIFTPSFYNAGSRPLLTWYTRLAPSKEFIGVPGTGFVNIGYGQELCNYFTKSSNGGRIGYTYHVFDDLRNGESHFLRRTTLC